MKQRNHHFGQNCAFDTKTQTCQRVVWVLAFLSTFASLVFCTNINAQENRDLSRPRVIVPEKISGVATVTAEQLIESLTLENAPLLIDARIKDDRNFGFIESSISLPDNETNCTTLDKIAEDKNRDLVFYCNGVQCGRSVVSIKIALSCGYQNLSWFKGGFAEWKAKGYQYVTEK